MDVNGRIKACIKCTRRYVESKGFYLAGDYYETVCKTCKGIQTTDHDRKSKNYIFKYHAFIEEKDNKATCQRCGLKRKKTAIQKLYGRWHIQYYLRKKWVDKLPLRKAKKEWIKQQKEFIW